MELEKQNKTHILERVGKISARKWLGVPVSVLLIIALGATFTTAAVLYFTGDSMDIDLEEPATLITGMPDVIQAFGGDYYNYSFTIKDESNEDLKFTSTLNLTDNNGALENDEAKIQILFDGIVVASSTTATGGMISAVDTDRQFTAGETKNGELRIQFAPSADASNYTLSFAPSPGTFDWKN